MMLKDHDARERIRNDLDTTLIVEAAAGTGKTTELVNRIVSVLASGRTTVDRIVAVTFTDKAAGELKLRLREELEKARTKAGDDEERHKNLEEALAHLEEARAGTIHSFCGDLLRERPVEASIDPKFEVLDETSAEKLYASLFRDWMVQVLENPPEGIRRSLRRYSRDDEPMARLERAGWMLAAWRDFPAPWSRPSLNREDEIDRLVKSLHEFAVLTRKASDTEHVVYSQTRAGRDLNDYIATVEKSHPRDYDGVEARLVTLSNSSNFKIGRKGPAKYGTGVSRDEVMASHAILVASLQQFADRADADLAALLATELRESLARYETAKQVGSGLDFFDLLVRARGLLRDNAVARRELQERFTHIFIDEFQDTDPLQAEVLMLLAASDPEISDWRKSEVVPGKLFIVGDPKQAIYRFRRADVGLYYEIRDRLLTAGAVEVQLTNSFRSVPSIQNFVNAAFQASMDGNRHALQAQYVPLAPVREQPKDLPSVVALSIPEPYGKARLSGGAVERSLPDTVGAFVDWVLGKSGWTVTERGRGDERVRVKARHICLLFRRFEKWMTGDMTRAYAEALQARGIAHVLVGGKAFHDREEVGTIRSALSAIEWPDDALSVYATLHGSLFAISDADLLSYRNEHGHWHPFRVPPEISQPLLPVKRALEVLRELSRHRNIRPISETIHRLLTATRAHAGFVMRPGGEQALANVLHVAELARQYEVRGAVSFRGFVEELLQAAEAGSQAEAMIFEEGSEGVRMMSVHKAKGLEFPIVILADVTCKIAHEDPSRYLDARAGLCAIKLAGWTPEDVVDHATEEHARDVAEGIRITYVAATRARDLLVVPAIGDDTTGHGPAIAEPWWTAPLNSALYPREDRRQHPAKASLCPAFGIDSVKMRPDNDIANETTVRPGSHEFGNGADAYRVVWWDPNTLDLGKAPSFSIRQQELLERGDETIVQKSLSDYASWRNEREQLLARGASPTLRIQTATDRSKSEIPFACDVVIEEIARKDRPSGPRFGSLVHGILSSVPLGGSAEEVSVIAELEGRILGAERGEIEAAILAVTAVLQHPLMKRARISSEKGCCYRELPLTLLMDDGTLIEGITDLAFREEDRWTVVDFKTDHEIESGLDRYCRQISVYAKTITEVHKQQCSSFLLKI
jgi:ATP-dependent exoDNAse (exonuclease V) beta subunit